jgi:hypothetical protein
MSAPSPHARLRGFHRYFLRRLIAYEKGDSLHEAAVRIDSIPVEPYNLPLTAAFTLREPAKWACTREVQMVRELGTRIVYFIYTGHNGSSTRTSRNGVPITALPIPGSGSVRVLVLVLVMRSDIPYYEIYCRSQQSTEACISYFQSRWRGSCGPERRD